MNSTKIITKKEMKKIYPITWAGIKVDKREFYRFILVRFGDSITIYTNIFV